MKHGFSESIARKFSAKNYICRYAPSAQAALTFEGPAFPQSSEGGPSVLLTLLLPGTETTYSMARFSAFLGRSVEVQYRAGSSRFKVRRRASQRGCRCRRRPRHSPSFPPPQDRLKNPLLLRDPPGTPRDKMPTSRLGSCERWFPSSRPPGSYRMMARIEIAEHRHCYKSRVTCQCKSALS